MTEPMTPRLRFRLQRRVFARLLAHRGFRPVDLASAVGVSRATVSRWEHGTLAVRGDHALTVAALLNARFGELFAPAGRWRGRQATREARRGGPAASVGPSGPYARPAGRHGLPTG